MMRTVVATVLAGVLGATSAAARPGGVVGFGNDPVAGRPAGQNGAGLKQSGAGAGPATAAPSLLIAGHFLRRLGFGPTPEELTVLQQQGPGPWLAQQFDPGRLQQCIAQPDPRYAPGPSPQSVGYEYAYRWLTRMVYSPCQLQEKMALFWHEHFASSVNKTFVFIHFRDQESFFRAHALSPLRELLVGITKDNAMLGWLDNDGNNGNAETPPNENYARELMQLFALGPYELTEEGDIVFITDPAGTQVPKPTYGEEEVKALARQLTGWSATYPTRYDPNTGLYDPTEEVGPATFDLSAWDCRAKTLFGTTIAENCGAGADPTGETQVQQAIDLLLTHHNAAPFFVTEVLKKFYKENLSSPEEKQFVYDLVQVFRNSGGNVAAVLWAAFTDPRFVSPSAVRTMYKTPIEQLTNMIRGLSGSTQGVDVHDIWGYETAYRIYEPPSVFSFYRPGRKSALVNTALVVGRDSAAADVASNPPGNAVSSFDAAGLLERNHIQTADQALDFLSQNLLAAPLTPAVRQLIKNYLGDGQVTAEQFRGAAFLIMASPDFQVN